jgi:Acetyltransferase (GNAT) domain
MCLSQAGAVSTSPDFFSSPLWFETLRGHGMQRLPDGVLWSPLCDVAGRQIGRLPLYRAGHALYSLSNYYSALYGPVMSSGHGVHEVDWSAWARWMADQEGSAVIQLMPLAEDGPFLHAAQAALCDRSYLTDRFFCFGNWYLPWGDGQDAHAYWQGRPSRLRHTVERAERRLARSHDWRVDIVQGPGDALTHGIAAYQSVYAGSWKEPEPNPAFMPSLMQMAAHQGSLRLGMLWLDGQVVAAQVWFVHEGVAHIFKLAYLPGHEKLSLGSVLTAALMRHVIDVDGVREVDFGSGDDDYKRDWMSHRRERLGLVAFHVRRPAGLWAAARHVGGRRLRRVSDWLAARR